MKDGCMQASPEHDAIGLQTSFDIITLPTPVSQYLPTSLLIIVHVCETCSFLFINRHEPKSINIHRSSVQTKGLNIRLQSLFDQN